MAGVGVLISMLGRCRWRQWLIELEWTSPVCCKPVSPSCSIAGCRVLAAPRQQRAAPLEVKTGISVKGGGDVPAGSLEKAP